MTIDVALCVLTVWIAYYLRLGYWVSLDGRPTIAVVLSIGVAIPIFHLAGLYRMAFRYFDSQQLSTVVLAGVTYAIVYAAIIAAYAFDGVPRTLGIIQPVLLFLAVCASRVAAPWLLTKRIDIGEQRRAQGDRVIIYGAGSSGRQLARAAAEGREITVMAFVDDDVSLQGSSMLGKQVHHPDRLSHLIDRFGVSEVLLAMPSVSRRRRNEIIEELQQLPVRLRILPGLLDLARGHAQISDLRELTIEDLLSRDPVDVDSSGVLNHISESVILVTGAGGSIGSELCRQLIKLAPARLLLLDHSEYALYAIHREIAAAGTGVEVIALLGTVTDRQRVEQIMARWRPHSVFHAAAYKHVPLVEHNPAIGVCNNVIGTFLVAELAIKYKVRSFTLVSTDKAVRPTNFMGASKRLAELCVQALAAQSNETCLSMVRFGNVLGSSGSVVPLFREQIAGGGPVTITHRDVTRYFMTIPEAAQLVVHASAMAKGGEVFVLEMGDPVKIYELARQLIELSGYSVRDGDNPSGDIEIVAVGLRPGEKLYEELLIGNDPLATEHPRIMKAIEPYIPLDVLNVQLDHLRVHLQANDAAQLRNLLQSLMPEYAPSGAIVDFIAAVDDEGLVNEPLYG